MSRALRLCRVGLVLSMKAIAIAFVPVILSVGTPATAGEAANDARIDYFIAKKDWASLAKLGKPAVPRLMRALADEDSWVRLGAAKTLGKIGHVPEKAADKVTLWLTQDKSKELVKMGTEAVDPLIGILRKAYSSKQWPTAARAANVLGKIADRRAVDPLIAVANGDDWTSSNYSNVDNYYPVTCAAVEALGEIGDPKAYDQLVALLEGGKAGARVWDECARALGRIGDARAIEPMLKKLMKYPLETYNYGPRWKATIIAAIAELRTGSAKALIAALKHKTHGVRSAVCSALGNVGDKTAVPALCEMLQDKEATVRRAAADALAKLKDERAIKPLVQALGDSDSTVRERVAKALDALGWKP